MGEIWEHMKVHTGINTHSEIWAGAVGRQRYPACHHASLKYGWNLINANNRFDTNLNMIEMMVFPFASFLEFMQVCTDKSLLHSRTQKTYVHIAWKTRKHLTAVQHLKPPKVTVTAFTWQVTGPHTRQCLVTQLTLLHMDNYRHGKSTHVCHSSRSINTRVKKKKTPVKDWTIDLTSLLKWK